MSNLLIAFPYKQCHFFIDTVTYLPLVLRSLGVMCLNMDFFMFILFGVCSTSWSYRFMSHQIWEIFSYYFYFSASISLTNFFSFALFLLSFQHYYDINVRCFVILPFVHKLFSFYSLAFYCSDWVIPLFFFKLTDAFLCHLISPLSLSKVSVILLFSSKISIWLFFITSISLRGQFFHLVQAGL